MIPNNGRKKSLSLNNVHKEENHMQLKKTISGPFHLHSMQKYNMSTKCMNFLQDSEKNKNRRKDLKNDSIKKKSISNENKYEILNISTSYLDKRRNAIDDLTGAMLDMAAACVRSRLAKKHKFDLA